MTPGRPRGVLPVTFSHPPGGPSAREQSRANSVQSGMKLLRCVQLWLPIWSLTVLLAPLRAAGVFVADTAHWPIEPPPGIRPPRPPHPPWPPRPIPPPRPHPFAPLEVRRHLVTVKIQDQTATTTVEQELYNPNPTAIEGSYLFPLPKGAQIERFGIESDGRTLDAELLPAEKAHRIYEEIVRRSRDPALLEYADRDAFRVRVFPIGPRASCRLRIAYTQWLRTDHGLVRYVYPLRVEKFSASPILQLGLRIELSSAQPLKSLYSPTHTVEIHRPDPHHATVRFEARDARAELDFALYFSRSGEGLGVNLLAHKTDDEDGFFLLLLSPGPETADRTVLPRDVAFVLDTSGSMAGKKIEQAKNALRFCIENLNPEDRFEILRFSSEVEPLFGQLRPANRLHRDQAADFVEQLRAIGGTALDEALARALALRPPGPANQTAADRPFVVLLLTDGRPTVGETDEARILTRFKQANPAGTRVFCFGIGTDVNTHLLDGIAEATRAASEYILPEEDLELKVSNFFSKISHPVLADPSLQFEGDVRVSALYPSPLPDLFCGDQLVLVGRYRGQGDARARLEGTSRESRRQFTWPVRFPDRCADHDFIPRLWATRRIGHLLDQIRLHGESEELKDEITELARRYGLVTPYTAYLIVEDETRRRVPLPVQTLPQLGADPEAQHEAALTWQSFRTDRSGQAAVAGARHGLVLRSAQAPSAAAERSWIEAERGLGLLGASGASPQPPGHSARVRLVEASRQHVFVGGRAFYLNADGAWVDALSQRHTGGSSRRIQFNSPEYFGFAAAHPEALPWLALGERVRFVLNGALYEIHP